MKRILSLTLGFAALSLIGCPPPVQPTSTGTATGTAPATEAVVEEIIEETVIEEAVVVPEETTPAEEAPAAPAEEAPAAPAEAAPAAPAEEAPAAPAEEAPAAPAEEAAPAAPAEEAAPAAPAEEAPAAPAEEAPAAPAEEAAPAAPAEEAAPAAPAEEAAPAAPAEEAAPAAPAEEAAPAAPAEEAPAAPAEEAAPAAPAEEAAPAAPAEEAAPAAPAEEAPAAPAEEAAPAAPAAEEPAIQSEGTSGVEETSAQVGGFAERIAEEAEDLAERVAEKAEDVAEKAVEKAEDVAEKAEDVAEKVAEKAEDVAKDVAEKAEEVAENIVSRANPPQPKVELNPAFKPAIYATLPDYCPVPDGMTLDEKTNIIYLNCPNYVPADENGKREFNACLMQILPDGTVEKVLEYPVHPQTGKIGSMGIDICPAGNLYVCDNQRFSTDPQGQVASRVLRIARDENGKVIFDENGKPDVRVVIEGINLANALLWDEGNLYITDTVVPTQGDEFGRGGIWKFTGEEIKKAVENNEVIKVDAKAGDAHLIVTAPVKKIGREDFSGADGMTKAWDAIYFGNFGDGVIRKVTFDEAGKPVVEVVVDRDDFQCCDGIFYDKVTDLIYIDDSQANAIRTLDKDGNLNILWINPDTDGADGSLDQPAECIVRDGKLIMANFDWTFPGLTNAAHDKPYTLSVIDVTSLAKAAPAAEEPAAPAEEAPAVEEPAAPAEEAPAAEEPAAPAAEEPAAPAEEAPAVEEAAAPAAEEATAPAAEEAAAPAVKPAQTAPTRPRMIRRFWRRSGR